VPGGSLLGALRVRGCAGLCAPRWYWRPSGVGRAKPGWLRQGEELGERYDSQDAGSQSRCEMRASDNFLTPRSHVLALLNV
jgi:hypothetical protein